jgi:hypothetical protein
MYRFLYADMQNFDAHLKPELRSAWNIAFAPEATAPGSAISPA